MYDSLTETRATFAQPVVGSSTREDEIQVAGSIANPPSADEDIWLVVRPQVKSTWYPAGRLLLQPNDQWTAQVALGSPGNYQLYLFLADSAASSEFHQYVVENRDNTDPPGMLKPPVGAELLSAVKVERIAG